MPPILLPTSTPQLSKEYIYAGGSGKLLAVEDANANAVPPSDLGIWRPSTGYWWIMNGQTSQYFNQAWGISGDIPVPGDYDANGNLTQKTDARGVVTNYVYDALNRVTQRNYSAPQNLSHYQTTPNVIYTYDDPQVPFSKGKLTRVSSSVSETRYTVFDNVGRVVVSQQITDGQIYNSSYVYNLSGALIEETYPSGRVVRNVLDSDGDLSIVQSKKNADFGYWNYARHFTYTASGAVSSMQLGNGLWESTQFNSRLQPTQIALGAIQNATDKIKLNYDYGTTDNNGNVKSQTITVPGIGQNQGFTAVQTYVYDSLNRLKSATENINGNPTPSWKQTFVYDRFGNRRFDAANTTTLGSCPANQCNPLIDQPNNRFTTGQGYVYDLSGNLIQDAEGRQFIYDAENKQTEVRNAENQIIGRYFYDGDGRRVKKVVPSTGETTLFVYDASGKMVAEYSTIVTPQSEAKVSYLTTDHLGSPRVITDQNGQVVSRRDFHPFGEEIYTAQRTQDLNYAGDTVRQKFTGYERDIESDLDYAQARYYESKHGRFTTTDPILMTKERKFNPQEINLYAYVRNNPLAFVDPFGEEVDFAGKKNSDEYKRNKQHYEDYKKYVDSLKDDNPDKAKLQATIKRLEESGVTYVINVSTDIKGRGAEVEGNVEPDEQGEKIMVNIRNLGNKSEVWSLNSRFAHELEHARQFDAGEIGFERRGDSGWSVMAFDHFDEVDAYRASVAIAVTNGADNTNPKLRGIITGFQDAKGDSARELSAYARFRGLGDKEVIRQSNIRNINFENVSDGLQKTKFKGGMQIYCNRGCGKK